MTKGIERALHAGATPAIWIVAFALAAVSSIASREGERNLADMLGEGDGKLPSWVVFSEESFSDGLANFFAAVPRTKDARDVLLDPVDGSGASRHEDNDYGFSGFMELLYKKVLVAG